LRDISRRVSRRIKREQENKKVEELYTIMNLLAMKVSEIVEQPKPDVVPVVAEACKKPSEEVLKVLGR